MRTLPDLLTATIITRGFLFSGGELGGAGVDGCAASSVMRTWVMYDSTTVPVEIVSLKCPEHQFQEKFQCLGARLLLSEYRKAADGK